MQNRAVYIMGGVRTPFVKSLTSYRRISNQDLMTTSLHALAERFGLLGQTVGDVAIGATIKNSLDWNLARECVLGSGLSAYTPGYGVQRACGSSLDATLQIALKIGSQQMNLGIAGGVDTNSDLPVLLPRSFAYNAIDMRVARSLWEKCKAAFSFRLSDFSFKMPSVVEPRTGLSMGEHCEKMVKEWGITRQEQDALALISHQNAAKAYAEGFYDDLLIPVAGISKDTIVRSDTSMEKLSRLKTAFDFTDQGTLTAGNSSPLTDGASSVLLAAESEVNQHQWTPLAKFVDAEVAAVDYVHGDGLLMAPTIAVARMLARRGLSLQDFDYYEIHEAFAGQVLCTLKAWESAEYCKNVLHLESPMGAIDRNKMNVKGGSVALGHPFAATGTRIVASLAKLLFQTRKRRGLISICTAGGMGVAAIIEGV